MGGRTPVLDLKPSAGTVIVRSCPRGLGHVTIDNESRLWGTNLAGVRNSHRDRALVVDRGVQGEGERVASLDAQGLSRRIIPGVASQAGIGQVCHGRVVGTVLANVLLYGVLGPCHCELLKDVMRRGLADSQRDGGCAEKALHHESLEGCWT